MYQVKLLWFSLNHVGKINYHTPIMHYLNMLYNDIRYRMNYLKYKDHTAAECFRYFCSI